MECSILEYERKAVTVTWEIENVKYIQEQNKLLQSPVISIDAVDGTKWKLGLLRIRSSDISLNIKREAKDNGPENIELDYEFSVYCNREKYSTSMGVSSCKFLKNETCPKVEMNLYELRDQKEEDALFPDNITIRCKIWKHREYILEYCHYFARTRMKTKTSIFRGDISNFSNVSRGDRRHLTTVSLYANKEFIKVNLVFSESYCTSPKNTMICVEIIPKKNLPEQFVNLKLFVLDTFGNKTDIGKFEKEFIPKSYEDFSFISKEHIMENDTQLLTNDTLSLQCDITFCSGKEFEIVKRTEYEIDFNGKRNGTELKQTDFLNVIKGPTSEESTQCYTKLQTATETFLVNTTILSAKSPAFEAMFQSDMKETIEKCVHIEDVHADIVRHMLVFLYTETLEEMDWKDAMKLYIAADKYLIASLKSKCIALLNRCIDVSNCCCLLLLGDLYQDEELKTAVREYISVNTKAVLFCDKWRDLEKNHPYSVIKFYRYQYMEIFPGRFMT